MEPTFKRLDAVLGNDGNILERVKCLDLRPHDYKGKLIIFEGVDGAGKSTSLEFTCDYLEENGVNYHKIDMLSPEFRQLSYHRSYADDHTRALKGEVDQTSIAICALGDRLLRFRTIFREKLKAGEWLVCDRYIFTPLSEALALGISDEDLKVLFQIASLFPKPDLGFVASVQAEEAIKRIRARVEEKDKALDVRFYRRANKAFIENGRVNNLVQLDTGRGHQFAQDVIKSSLKLLTGGWTYE